ncbi:unnamed protein product [Lactuca virosa]|uniref:Disease resistance protein Roq1-like winged-helix domain-containing protein n=1 Tax=Lactuca virosa TaxID=75947 RepID=A0AAU9N0K6_9ASTR|nr:unnamed protein product [Lactuca virosa]
MHTISLLSGDEAIKLFCKHARWDHTPTEDYEQLSKEVVSYAGGLPLALAVLGSFLCDKNINEWRSALARLKEIPNDNILETLKISFDGLTKVERELFLDIACFFRGREKDEAMGILEAFGFYPVIGVKVLIQKALITISDDGEFDMHDLVQEMGVHIVGGENPRNPEKHSRIWKKEDVLKICAMDATTELDKIEAIHMDFRFHPAKEKEHYLPSVAANMKNLRYMESIGDPAKYLFDDLPLRELCCLILCEGSQKQLWDGCKLLPSLKLLKLCDMNNLIMTPDFNGLPNLERFTLHGCWYLEEIHPSIGCLEKLVYLSIEGCPRLEMFPPIRAIKKLETLSFSGSLKLIKFPKIQQQNLENLPHFDMDNSGNEVASYVESYPNIFFNRCSNIPGVECCVEEPDFCDNIRLGVFNNLQELRFLRKLDLRWCNSGDEAIGSDVLEFPNLQQLNLFGNKFSRVTFSCLQLPRLKWLNVSWCQELVELSQLPSSIVVVIADNCSSLESFGDISNCKRLLNVSLKWKNKIGPLVGEILLDSMLKGKAIENHFISFSILHQIPKGFVGHLEIDSRFEIWQESNEAPEPEYGGDLRTHVEYVSFSSLRQTTSLNPSYNIISFSIKGHWTSFAAELVPRKSKDHPVQTTKVAKDSSEFWNEENDAYKPFMIQDSSKSSINIKWR